MRFGGWIGDFESGPGGGKDVDGEHCLAWTNIYLITDTLPRQVYLHLLLRLPAMYFSRVARIFEDAEVTAAAGRGEGIARVSVPVAFSSPSQPTSAASPPVYPPALYSPSPEREQQRSIGAGIGLTAHVVSAAVGGLVDDLSLVCAIMILSYGCVFIVRLGP
ncbi:hypothetical protein BDQ17DRAFT_1543604 [Cyathus striatus]|nr:hypothetical protein BDQ17DRAFT_1543604 [Cyathus striatus]